MADNSWPGELLQLLGDCLTASSDSPRRWESFVEQIHGLLAGMVVRTLRQFSAVPTPELIDDLVQDTYLKLCADDFAVLRRFRGGRPEALVAYLRAVAFSVTRDHLRITITKKRGSGRVDAPGDEAMARAADPHTEGDPAERHVLLTQIDRWLLSSTGAAAGDRDRWIFWLYYRYGLTARAISDIPALGLSQKGVESIIYRLTHLVRGAFGEPDVAVNEGFVVEKASR